MIQNKKKVNLNKYEAKLKQFKYQDALIEALDSNPEMVVSLIEELIIRGALEKSLCNLE
jgi:protein associated with RNAse G/E